MSEKRDIVINVFPQSREAWEALTIIVFFVCCVGLVAIMGKAAQPPKAEKPRVQAAP
jgi:beta-lactamase regulating signal transducer with metallopeptidase domain